MNSDFLLALMANYQWKLSLLAGIGIIAATFALGRLLALNPTFKVAQQANQAAFTAKMAKLKCALYEVPISYYGRTYEEGKKITYRDGIAALYYVIRFNLFCSKRSSFKALPDVGPRPLIDVGSNQDEPI